MKKIVGYILMTIGSIGLLAVMIYILWKIWVGLAIIITSFVLFVIGLFLCDGTYEFLLGSTDNDTED